MKPHVILFALVIGYASASVAAPPSLVLPANTADVDDTTSAAIVLPYDLDPGWRVAQIDVGDVALGGRRDADLTAAVPSAIALDGTRLQLTVLRAKLRWAGSYQVVLRFTLVPVAPASGAGSGAAAPAPAAPASGSADPEAAEHRRGHDDAPVITSLAVTLNRVAPKLDAAAAVSIRITSQWWVFWSQQTITPLALAETSRRASFAQLAVRQRGVTVNDGAPTDVALTVTVIPPGP
ncbi:MAG TPA: hypothetical protein VH165_21215, partial [Kofleriaceae bacterium]|nr:hypothetical protein [Kofleriaceae bacterium]